MKHAKHVVASEKPSRSVAREPAPSREQQRSRRKRAVRAHTICVKRLTKLEIALGRILYPDVPVDRPKTRADCAGAERPCPFVSCSHHLYLDVLSKTGAIKLNFPDLEVWEMKDTCALDVTERGGATLEEVGEIMNLTRERIRQVEVTALAKLEALGQLTALRDHYGDLPATRPGPGTAAGKRRLPTLPVTGRSAPPAEADDDSEDDGEDADEEACY